MKYKGNLSKDDMDSKFKDEYDYSPAYKSDYDYKYCIAKEFHMMGTMSEPAAENDDDGDE